MKHPESRVFSEYLDGELSPREARELEAHLGECPTCGQAFRELSEVQRLARSLPDRLPQRDLWPGIAQEIRRGRESAAQVIRLHPWQGVPSEEGKGRGFRLSYLQAAAAGIALVLLSGTLGAFVGGSAPGPPQESVSVPAPWVELVTQARPGLATAVGEITRLEALLNQHRGGLDAETVRILEKNLDIIDQAIRESVRALQSDPENNFLESHLARSLESKARYLREATAFVVPVS